jgi:hypothetical protein
MIPENKYPTLSIERRATGWMDTLWDERAGLIWYPDRARGYSRSVAGPVHMVRETAYYAIGLLRRGSAGDLARACRAIDAIARYQFNAPGQPHHGTFCRYPAELAAPAQPIVWHHYDPNWREFIGLALLLVLEDFAPRLTRALVEKIEAMLALAAHGSAERRVNADYTNIALMSFALLEAVGRRQGRPALVRQGEELAGEVFARFSRSGALDEFNSPTYYGISLAAVMHLRRPGVSDPLKRVGAAIEASIWRDTAGFYHAGMRNLCGPFDRAYGMDMQRYVATMAIWIAFALGGDDAGLAPLPVPIADATTQAHDFCFAPYFAALHEAVPPQIVAALAAVPAGRAVTQTICSDPPRTATAWLEPRIMIGAEHTHGTRRGDGQFHAATWHWQTPDGAVGTGRVRSPHAIDAVVEKNRLSLIVRRLPATDAAITADIDIELPAGSAGDSVQTALLSWKSPGLAVAVTTNAADFSAMPTGGGITLRYSVSHDTASLQLELAFRPN